MNKFAFSILTENKTKLPFYLVGAGLDFHQDLDPHKREAGYPYYQWIQVAEGSGCLRVDGKEFSVGPNQGILLFPEVPHEYNASEPPWVVNWITFGGKQVLPVLELIGFEESGVYSIVNANIMTAKIKRALSNILSETQMKSFENSSLVYDFLIDMMKYAHKSGDEPVARQYRRLEPVFRYVESNYRDIITIEDMANVISVTPQHLCLLFKKSLSQRPFEYLNAFRINKSKDIMLNEPDIKISKIAKLAGYECSSYFCSVFKKTEGISPGKFRELYLRRSE